MRNALPMTFAQQICRLAKLWSIRQSTVQSWIRQADIRLRPGHPMLTSSDITQLEEIRAERRRRA